MVGGISGGYNASAMYGTKNYLSQKASSVNNFDYKAAQRDTQKLIDQYKDSNKQVQTLKKESANFLDDYRTSMQDLGKAADKVSGGNFDKMLYGKGGTGSTPTQENIDKTAKAVEDLAAQFNNSLKLVNDNANRGQGVGRQISRMVQSPTSEQSMAAMGITTQKDGTLKVDSAKLKTALKDNASLARDVIGGSFGMSQGIKRDSTGGLNQSPASLIGRDIASMKQLQNDSISNVTGIYSKMGAYSNMNLNSVGVLMNIMI